MNNFFKAVRDFLSDYLPNRRGRSPNTVQSYRDALKLLIAFLRDTKGYKLSQIDFNIFSTVLIYEFLDWLKQERKCGVTSINQRITALRSFFRFAADRDCTLIALSQEIDKKVKAVKAEGKTVGYLSENALQALLAQPDEKTSIGLRNLTFLVLMYDTGARCGEILQLRVRDLRIKVPHPEIFLMGKGKKPRFSPLMPKTVSHCERYLKDFHPNRSAQGNELLFYTVIHGERNPMSADTVAAFMKKYGETARLACNELPEKIHPHMMRHTRAMHFYSEGMPRIMLAEYLGHADIQSTKPYVSTSTEMKRKAVEKVDATGKNTPEPAAIWENDDDMIMRLAGLS